MNSVGVVPWHILWTHVKSGSPNQQHWKQSDQGFFWQNQYYCRITNSSKSPYPSVGANLSWVLPEKKFYDIIISSVWYNTVLWYFNLVCFSVFVTKYMSIVLMLSILGKKTSTEDNLDIFSYFSQNIGSNILYKLPPQWGDNLHEMPEPLYYEKIQKKKNIIKSVFNSLFIYQNFSLQVLWSIAIDQYHNTLSHGSSWSFQRGRFCNNFRISGRSFGQNFGFPYTFYTFSLLPQLKIGRSQPA